jgi:hypothetical protein
MVKEWVCIVETSDKSLAKLPFLVEEGDDVRLFFLPSPKEPTKEEQEMWERLLKILEK